MGPDLSDVSLWEPIPEDDLKLGSGLQESIGGDLHKGNVELRFFNDPGIRPALQPLALIGTVQCLVEAAHWGAFVCARIQC